MLITLLITHTYCIVVKNTIKNCYGIKLIESSDLIVSPNRAGERLELQLTLDSQPQVPL